MTEQGTSPDVQDETLWDGPFQILALDGGGAKALFTAHVLAHIEDDLGVNVTDHFDLIAGTSAGGIVALGLGAGLSPAQIAEHFSELVDMVFPKARQRRARASRLTSPAYDSDTLREALTNVLGTKTINDSNKRLLIPSWDMQTGEVHVFKTRHHDRLVRDSKLPMVDVALATSAAPTYFRAARVNHVPLIDGGVWANNPSVIAIAEAVSMLAVPLKAIRVLNISTMSPFADHKDRLATGGLLRWGTKAASVILNANTDGAIGTAVHFIGEDDFFRWDEPVPPKKFALDRIDSRAVQGYAAAASRKRSTEFTAHFAAHKAAPFTPLPPPAEIRAR
jgi:patatin-like phospholipase/acyl hydrolase